MTSSSEEEGTLVVKEEFDENSWTPNARHSAFSPYRPVTILTNLQRGNVETTQTAPILPNECTFHNKAAMGELTSSDFTDDLDVNALDSNSLTPVMWAAFYGQLPTVRLLIQNQALVDVEGPNGETALMLAASGGHHEICRLLLTFNADPNKPDKQGNTALMYATYSDAAHCVSELLENGADATITETNVAGDTAYSIVIARGSKKAQVVIERFLLRLLENS